jgi:hypothetical protein
MRSPLVRAALFLTPALSDMTMASQMRTNYFILNARFKNPPRKIATKVRIMEP